MADSIVGAVINFVGDKLLQCIAEPIKRRYNYLRHFDSNIQKLRGEKGKLEATRDGLQMQVNTAKDNAEVILPEVDTWFKDVDEILVKMSGIESGITRIRCGCFAVKSRLSLSKKVEDTAGAMRELQGRYHSFNRISNPAPPAAAALVPLGSTYDFQSRKDIEEDIMKALRDDKVNIVGISGMGGVGKTTMAKRIMKRVKEGGLFDETVMVVVSQKVDMSKIQDGMAEQLGLELTERDSQSRAHKLRTRLTCGKKILVVLDDVWATLNLEELGIPCEIGSKGCMVLLTSRDSSVLNKMDAQIEVCEILTLSGDEALSLFKGKVGPSLDDQNLLSVAREIVEECKGLPVALVTVGGALKNQIDESVWKAVLDQLKSSNPEDIPDIIAEVYSPLKLSYDFLVNKHAKSIFLLCCLFPEDYDINLEELTVYAIGLGMYEKIKNLEQARHKTRLLIEMLKSRFLLLEGRDKDHVRMHDVVRDVAIFIASEKKRIRHADCSWISPFVEERIEPSETFPNLHLLMIDESNSEKLQIDDNFFRGKEELNVLRIEYDSLTLLPSTIDLLKDLRTLILDSCESLETIYVVGKLVKLEILICRNSDSIQELPLGIGGLNRLRLLEISNCTELKTIAPGIISRLVQLEELKIESFDKWERENNKDQERKNVGLKELESLTSLTHLKIQIKDSTLAGEQIHLSPKIEKFEITIGDCNHWRFKFDKGSENNMDLHLPKEITLANWILKVFRDSKCVIVEGEVRNLELGLTLQNKWSLALIGCSMVKQLMNTTTVATIIPHLGSLELVNLSNLEEICHIDGPIPDKEFGSNNAFKLPKLKILKLADLPKLTTFCKRIESIGFPLLTEIVISNCPQLKSLASITTASAFPHLESLELLNLINLEEISHIDDSIPNEGSRFNSAFKFPKLKILKLWDLPNLTTFYKGIESIKFPLLTYIYIKNCPQLNSVSSTSSSGCGNDLKNLGGINYDHDNDVSLHLFCKPEKVAFGSLKDVTIDGYESSSINTLFSCRQITADFFTTVLEELQIINCGNIRSLFSSPIARSLVHLKTLSIHDCPEMVKVIEDEEQEEKDSHAYGREITDLFPMLRYLDLHRLPKLKVFGEWKCTLVLPSLKDMRVKDCPEMERFTWGSLNTPKLENFRFEVKEEESFYKWEARLKGITSKFDGYNDELSFLRASRLLKNSRSEHTSVPSNTGKLDNTIVCFWDFRFSLVGFEKLMHLHLPKEITLKNWIQQCVKSVDYMQLEGEGLNNLDMRQAQNMRLLILKDCSWVKKFVDITTLLIDDGRCGTSTTTGFPRLEYLKLQNLANLEEMCDLNGQISTNFFKNLKELSLVHLPALKHLLANDWLLQLERIQIKECEMLEQIFLWNEEEENKRDIGHESRHIIFPKLKSLMLQNLANLVTFYKRIENIEFPLLTKMVIVNCPNLKCFVSIATSSGCGDSQNNLGGIIHDDVGDDDSLHWFCRQDKVAFDSLKKLEIWEFKNTLILECHQISIDFFKRLESLYIREYGGIKSLFSSSTARNLVNLRKLEIWGCEKMVKVIEDDNKEKDSCGGGETTNCLFPKLEKLDLDDLPNLKSFCEWRCAVELPSLKSMWIDDCPQLERFSLGSPTTPNLKKVEGDFDLIITTNEDLNGTLQRRLFRVKKQQEKKKMEEEVKKEAKENEGEEREQKEEDREREQKIEIEKEQI